MNPNENRLDWSEEPFEPVYRHTLLDESQPSEATEPITFSSEQRITALGKRSRLNEPLSLERNMKQLRVETLWHHKFILNQQTMMMEENQHFIPKYIADRIPIPMKDLDIIYNQMIQPVERGVLQGEFVWIDNFYELRWPKTKIAGWIREQNAFMVAKVNNLVTSENNP